MLTNDKQADSIRAIDSEIDILKPHKKWRK